MVAFYKIVLRISFTILNKKAKIPNQFNLDHLDGSLLTILLHLIIKHKRANACVSYQTLDEAEGSV